MTGSSHPVPVRVVPYACNAFVFFAMLEALNFLVLAGSNIQSIWNL